ncbi:MAG: acylphosphatase [Bacteroidales bacterium]|jgi:acylphosphatase
MESIKINITGKIYHTGYRYFIKQAASQLDIKGCIFYCPDRSVRILAIGEANNMDKFINYCRIGNIDSSVEKVSMSQIPPAEFDSFEVVEEETSVKHINHDY